MQRAGGRETFSGKQKEFTHTRHDKQGNFSTRLHRSANSDWRKSLTFSLIKQNDPTEYEELTKYLLGVSHVFGHAAYYLYSIFGEYD